MEEFDEEQKREKKKLDKRMKPNKDGWTLVSHKKAKKTKNHNSVKLKKYDKEKDKKTILNDFYNFQRTRATKESKKLKILKKKKLTKKKKRIGRIKKKV